MNLKRAAIPVLIVLILLVFPESISGAFWVYTPRDKRFVNPKHAPKDTPAEQFEWAMGFFEQGDFDRAVDEFKRLVDSFRDSDIAPEALYYAGRSYEEQGKYWFAFQSYKRTVENYPYTRRLNEILERSYNIAGILDNMETSRLMGMELSLNMERSAEIYDKIIETSPFSPLAEKSLFRLGNVNRRMMKYREAMEAYERIITDHPQSDLIDEARYQLAYTKYEASLSPEYDQESTARALEDFQRLSDSASAPAIAAETERVLSELRSRKAESTLKTAQFYDRQNKAVSALLYYRDIEGKFPETEAAEFARERIKHLEAKVEKR